MLISQNTKKQIDLFISKPSNSLIIESPARGLGLDISYDLVRRVLELPADYDLDNFKYFYKIEKENNTVPIESIRDLIKKLKLKSLDNKIINRVGFIVDADLMSDESQNSILKLLEEPPRDTIIILLTKSINVLNSTILSRASLIRITKPTYTEFIEYYSDDKLGEDMKNKYDLADGNADYYLKSVDVKTNLSESEDIVLIKKFLSSTKSGRLSMINDFCVNKLVFENLMFLMKNIIKIGLDNSIQKNNNQVSMWISYLKAIEVTETGSMNLVNRKLLFTNLCLNM